MKEILDWLFSMQDLKYRDFQAKLIPSVPKERVIGVRTPYLRREAKRRAKSKEADAFLKELPHTYFEENQLHAFLLCEEKDFSTCLAKTEAFLPYIDNWATCDQFSPPAFKQHKKELLPAIDSWLYSDQTYTIRFGIKQLMDHFLEEDFKETYLDKVAQICLEAYYVQTMMAWYFATALAKQYEAALPYLLEGKLPKEVHNRTIQKAVESQRIPKERKTYLKSLRR